jgi:mannose-6-phosphate isomerase-like protein (cupin superfamily)
VVRTAILVREASMKVHNRGNSRNTGEQRILTSWMLVSPQGSPARHLSLQVSEIPVGSEQPLHAHGPEQCYYIIRGKGLITIEEESHDVAAGDAVCIPPNKQHGMKNTGDGVLEYVTANAPPFSPDYEDRLWPSDPP